MDIETIEKAQWIYGEKQRAGELFSLVTNPALGPAEKAKAVDDLEITLSNVNDPVLTELYSSALSQKKITKKGRFVEKIKSMILEPQNGKVESAPKLLNQNDLIEMLKAEEMNREINPAQDFQDGIMYFTVTIRKKPYLVTSERRLISFETTEKEGITLRHQEQGPSRFSPAGIQEFLEGREVNIPELYSRIYDYIKRFVFLADTRVISYLSLWTMATYVFTVFRYFPYLWITAEKGSGKSLLMEILAAASFNGEVSTSPTEATLFRDVACNKTTLFLDEVERMRSQDKDTMGAVMSVLNTGFCKSGLVKRNVKTSDGNYVLKAFPTYSAKAFAGINAISDVLRDRTVCIHLLKKKQNEVCDRYKESDTILKLQRQIRDDCYIFALTSAVQIAIVSRGQEGQIQGLGHLTNRELDIWEPIILLANVIDGLTGKDEITKAMETFSSESLIEKQADSVDQNETYKLLSVAKAMIGEITPVNFKEGVSTFYSDKVLDYFKATEEFAWMTSKNQLTSRLKRINIKSEQQREEAGRVRVYKIELKNFEDLCERFQIQEPELMTT